MKGESYQIGYEVHISEYASERPWEDVVVQIRQTLPNLAGFVEARFATGEPFSLPRTFSLNQALRLVEMLGRMGLKAEILPIQDTSTQQYDEYDGSRSVESNQLRNWSRVLTFAEHRVPLPSDRKSWTDEWSWSVAAGWGLLFRLLGTLLAVPGWCWLAPAVADSTYSAVLGSAVGLWVVDVLLLWVGLVTVLPGRSLSAVRIEAVVGPIYVLEVIPLVGTVAGFFWRLALRIQLVTNNASVATGRAVLAVLLPWILLAGVLAMLGLLMLAGGGVLR